MRTDDRALLTKPFHKIPYILNKKILTFPISESINLSIHDCFFKLTLSESLLDTNINKHNKI